MAFDDYPMTSPEDQFLFSGDYDSGFGPGDYQIVGGGDTTSPIFDVGPGGEDLRDYTIPPTDISLPPDMGTGNLPDVPEFGGSTSPDVVKVDGKWYDKQGRLVWDPGSDQSGILGVLSKAFGSDAANKIKSLFINDKGLNIPMLGAIAGGIYGLTGGNKPTTGGYKGTIPQLAAVQKQVAQPEYVPYSGQPVMGRRYFSDVQYVKPGDAAAVEAANTASSEQAGILANYQPKVAQGKPPSMDGAEAKDLGKMEASNPNDLNSMINAIQNKPGSPRPIDYNFAAGGIARYLRGGTDGMADKIPSSIDNKQPAKLSHGEFVIPADVVSHLGNGNSDAGANVLYKMMDKVRKARTGTKKQGKRINPEKFTPGGIAAYASGGPVAFQTGGTTSVTSGTPSIGTTAGTTEQTLSPLFGDYVTNMLGRGQALAQTPYQAYQGPLMAGVSPLQQQAFQKASGLGGIFDASAAAQYMNPYLQQTLAPQMQAMQRQADIQRGVLGAQATKFGAFGGARAGLLGSQLNADLMRQQQQATGQAYQSAYDKAMGQYNLSKQQQIADISAMANLGATQRGIEQEGITAGLKQFEQEREDPYQKLKFQQSLLTGLPLSTTTTTPNLSPLQQLGLTGDQMTKLYDILNKYLNPATPATPVK